MTDSWLQSPGAAYIEGVLEEKIPVCQSIKLAVERAYNDHEQAQDKGLIYLPKKANRVVKYTRYCKHTKGKWANQPFDQELWQLFITGELFGWYYEDINVRRYRTAFIEIPKKNGKTFYVGTLGLYMLQADGENGAEVYVYASEKGQATIMFNQARACVLKSEALSKRIVVYRESLVIPENDSKMAPMPSDPDTVDGYNPNCQLVDEVHRHKTREIWDLSEHATDARENPLTIGITTAGKDLTSVCYEQHEYGLNILNKVYDDDRFFTFIATPDKGYDPYNELEWYKLNPNLGVTKTVESIRDKAKKAKQSPKSGVYFRRMQCNEWTQHVEAWLHMEDWNECPTEFDFEKLKGRICYGGIDLALSQDLSAVSLVFELDPLWVILVKFYCPEDSIKYRTEMENVPYQTWAEQGYIDVTEGNVTDFDYIYKDIISMGKSYQIAEIGFDPYRAAQLASNLTAYGFEMVQVRQGTLSMNEPMERLHEKIISRHLVHQGNPILNWNAANTVVREDRNKMIAPDKKYSKEKIDGIVATINAASRVIGNEGKHGLSQNELPFVVNL